MIRHTVGQRKPSAGKGRGGFTLVELLVVIGIIALLLSILLPSLHKARRAARKAACLSNIRQLVMAEMQYFSDSKYRFSPYYNGGTANNGQPQKFQIEWMSQANKPQQLNKVRLCPEAENINPAYSGNLNQNMPGAAFACWGPGGQALQDPNAPANFQKGLTGSYGYNGYCLRAGDPSGNDGTLGGNGQARDLRRLWVPPLKKVAEIPIIFDAVWATAWPKDPAMAAEGPPASLYAPAGGPPMGIANNWTRVCIARHNMAINVGFFDGHVSTVDLPALWLLPWHGPSTGLLAWQPPTENTNPKMSDIKKAIRDAYKG